jgi:hypothetical protein
MPTGSLSSKHQDTTDISLPQKFEGGEDRDQVPPPGVIISLRRLAHIIISAKDIYKKENQVTTVLYCSVSLPAPGGKVAAKEAIFFTCYSMAYQKRLSYQRKNTCPVSLK